MLRLIPSENWDFKSFECKVAALKPVSYKYLLGYKDVFAYNKSIALVYEFIQCVSLRESIKSSGSYQEDVVKKYLKHILKALHHLHTQGLIHGNLTSAKVLITAEGKAKLYDYSMVPLNGNEFSAPEVRQGRDPDSSSDIWSLGLLVMEMLIGVPIQPHEFVGTLFSNEIQDFVKICTHPTPQLRPSTKDLLQHGFFSLRDSFFMHRRCEAYSSKDAELVLSPNVIITKSPQQEGSTLSNRGLQDSFSYISLDEHSHIIESIDLNSSHLPSSLENLLSSIKDKPETKDSAAGQLVKLKEVIEMSQDDDITHLALQIITTLSDKSRVLLEKICIIGLMSSILPLASDANTRPIRIEVAYLIAQMFRDPELTQLCLASGALEVLPLLLDIDNEGNKDLIMTALDCMLPLSQNVDNLRVWSKCETAERLVMAFSSLANDQDVYLQKISELILAFAKGPKPECLCASEFLNFFLFTMREVPDKILAICLNIIQVLIPNQHNELENSGLIEDLIYFLKRSSETQKLVLICLINFCELAQSRYEQFAICGGVSRLVQIVESNENMDLALEILSILPAVSNGSRRALRENKALRILSKHLDDDRIIEALGKWIKADPLLESEILETENLEAIAEKISQETRLIKWEGVLESSNTIRKRLYEVLKRKGGNPRVLELIRQEMNRFD